MLVFYVFLFTHKLNMEMQVDGKEQRKKHDMQVNSSFQVMLWIALKNQNNNKNNNYKI